MNIPISLCQDSDALCQDTPDDLRELIDMGMLTQVRENGVVMYLFTSKGRQLDNEIRKMKARTGVVLFD